MSRIDDLQRECPGSGTAQHVAGGPGMIVCSAFIDPDGIEMVRCLRFGKAQPLAEGNGWWKPTNVIAFPAEDIFIVRGPPKFFVDGRPPIIPPLVAAGENYKPAPLQPPAHGMGA